MKASIAGLALLGSLITGQSTPPDTHKESTSQIAYSQKLHHKSAVNKILEPAEFLSQTEWDREDTESRTWDLFLELVSPADYGNIAKERQAIAVINRDVTISIFESDTISAPLVEKQYVADISSIGRTNIDSRLREYISFFQMELVYLTKNPELLESCKISKDREELRQKAITWIQKIIQTAPSQSSEMNSPEHESARNQLFKIRKQLYPDGELGYIYAQEWWGAEIMRQKKEWAPSQKRLRV